MTISTLTHIPILRFSDRDLLMRYHWGLGIGHLPAHRPASTSESCISDEPGDTELEDQYADLERDEDSADLPDADNAVDIYESDSSDSELGLDDVETDTSSGNDTVDDSDTSEHESEEDFVGM